MSSTADDGLMSALMNKVRSSERGKRLPEPIVDLRTLADRQAPIDSQALVDRWNRNRKSRLGPQPLPDRCPSEAVSLNKQPG